MLFPNVLIWSYKRIHEKLVVRDFEKDCSWKCEPRNYITMIFYQLRVLFQSKMTKIQLREFWYLYISKCLPFTKGHQENITEFLLWCICAMGRVISCPRTNNRKTDRTGRVILHTVMTESDNYYPSFTIEWLMFLPC